jgi:hypothetical protein
MKNNYSPVGIKITHLSDVFSLLKAIKNNPFEYLGGVKGSDSYSALVAYLNALEYSSYYDKDTYNLKSFKNWARKHHDIKESIDVYRWIENQYGVDLAFSTFFIMVDEYKKINGIE